MKIRILPMDINNSEFVGKSIKQVQKDFFMDYLKDDSRYYFETRGLNAEEGDLILFQMENTIIASAKYYIKMSHENAFAVIKNSVKIFKPITKEELSKIINGFNRFGNSMLMFKESDVNMESLNERINISNN